MEPASTLQETLSQGAALRGLRVSGIIPAQPEDGLSADIKSVVLLSPAPTFWANFTASHEYQGGLPNPMDRWSTRTIGRWARELEAEAYFPSDGPPYPPFFRWAQTSGQAWQSPVSLLVHRDMGLNVSYRGALGLRQTIPKTKSNTPCATCDAPCTTACPAGALTEKGYDIPACKTYVATHPDATCQTHGCLVRRACPVSWIQSPEQAEFHMAAFLE